MILAIWNRRVEKNSLKFSIAMFQDQPFQVKINQPRFPDHHPGNTIWE
jgi:hypothetical protein